MVPRSLFVLLMVIASMPGLALAQDAIREEITHKEVPAPKLTKPPKLLKFVPAEYPAEAQKKGIQGAVELVLDLDAKGNVAKAVVTKTPDPTLADAAVKAVMQFKFSPAEVDGKPSPIRVQYAYNFELELSFTPLLPEWMQPKRDAPKTKDPVAGRVREQGTRLPIPGVAVAIRDLGLEVQADNKGYFSFAGVPPGKYEVEAISPEHKRETVQVEVKKGEQSLVSFYLPRHAVNPYETVVRGKRRKTTVTRVTLRQKELTTVPGTFGDPVRVVENLPGVARIPLVGGALIIRGASPTDSAVFLDGVEIPQIYHFLGGPSVLNPQFLDRIDYYPGNADVRYGRLTAGVVDVQTRNTFTEQWGGSLDVNLLNTSVMLKVPVHEKVSVAGAVRRSYIDALMPTILKASDRSATTVVPVYYDYQLRVDVDLKKDDSLFVLAFGSDDQLAIATNEEEDPVDVSLDTQITFHRVLAGWRWEITDRLTSRLTPSVGVDYVTFDGGELSLDVTAVTLNLREDLEYRLSGRARWRFGADIVVANSDFDAVIPVPKDYHNPGAGLTSPADTTEKVNLGGWQFGFGLYTDLIFDLTDRLQVIPGARLEAYRYFGNNKLAAMPRLTGRYRLFKKTTLKAAAGMYSKPPEPREVNETWGNPNLTLEHAAHFSGGIEQQLTSAISLDAQLYYNRGYNMAVPTRLVKGSGATRRPLLFSNDGKAFSYGLELIVKHAVTERFYGWLAYTLSHSKRVQMADEDFVRAPFDQTHILTLVGSVKLGWGVEFGARFRLVSGRPETPILGGFFDSDPNRWMSFLGELRTDELPMFHQLDLRIEKTWMFKLWRMSVYIDVQNVYNAANPEATLWDYRFRESGPLRGLPILPTLGIKGSF